MKLSLFISFFCILALFILSVSSTTAQTNWSSEKKQDVEYNWHATKAELWDLNTEEKYYDIRLIGANCLPGGDIEIHVRSLPISDLNFFSDDYLDISVTVERDMGILSDGEYFGESDYYLIILPVEVDEQNFFSLLFEHQTLLENLTHSVYANSSIEQEKAIANFKYNNTLDVKYEWDINTEFLLRKEVTAPLGLQLIVEQGEGKSLIPYAEWYFILFFVAIIAFLFHFKHLRK